MDKTLSRIPHLISANSFIDLQKKMIALNVEKDTEFEYFDIQKDASQWLAFYYWDVTKIKASPKSMFKKKKKIKK